MKVSIQIEVGDLTIEVSDSTESSNDFGGNDVLATWWDNGTPLELIESVKGRAIAALQEEQSA